MNEEKEATALASNEGLGVAKRRTFLVVQGGDSPRRTCCEQFSDAEERGFISLTTGGVVLANEDEIVADISFCPFCGARWEIVN